MQVCTNICSKQVNPEPFTVLKRTFIEIVRYRKIRGVKSALQATLVHNCLALLSKKTPE
jgi:hypothetical protein